MVHPPSIIAVILPPSSPHGDRELFNVQRAICPNCRKTTLWLEAHGNERQLQLYPALRARKPAPPQVPAKIAADYNEAGIVLPLSAKASAALARRCLQHTLHANGFKESNLAKEIDAFVGGGGMPSGLAEQVHAVRRLGNIAAHPLTDGAGMILDVEENEALWLLELLDELFDHFYVGPARRAARMAALNAKK